MSRCARPSGGRDRAADSADLAHHASGAGQDLGRTPCIAVAGLNPHAWRGRYLWTKKSKSLPRRSRQRRPKVWMYGDRLRRTRSSCGRGNTPAHPGEFDVAVGDVPRPRAGSQSNIWVWKRRHVTLGLLLVRTSPDHGTAFDIAGQAWPMRPAAFEAVHMVRSLAS